MSATLTRPTSQAVKPASRNTITPRGGGTMIISRGLRELHAAASRMLVGRSLSEYFTARGAESVKHGAESMERRLALAWRENNGRLLRIAGDANFERLTGWAWAN